MMLKVFGGCCHSFYPYLLCVIPSYSDYIVKVGVKIQSGAVSLNWSLSSLIKGPDIPDVNVLLLILHWVSAFLDMFTCAVGA